MKTAFAFVLLLFISYPLAQAQQIRGIVVDVETDKPLSGVNISYSGIKEGTSTNTKGLFLLNTDSEGFEKNMEVTFSHIGYESFAISAKKLMRNNLKISLSKKTENLDEVAVVTKYKRKSLKFEKVSNMPSGLSDFSGFLVGSKIYCFGGNNSINVDTQRNALVRFNEANIDRNFYQFFNQQMMRNASFSSYVGDLRVFDLNTNTWTREKKKFISRAYHQVQLLNDKFYIFGGRTIAAGGDKEYLENKIEIFDIKKNKLQVDETNPHKASSFASFTFGDQLFVMGGSVRKKGDKTFYTDDIHQYDTNTGVWYNVGKMPEAKEATGIRVGKKFYLFGGYKDKPLKSIEEYTIKSNQWSTVAELPKGIARPSLATDGKKIYALDRGKLYVFDTETNMLLGYRTSLDLRNASLFYDKNHLYVLGGFTSINSRQHLNKFLYKFNINDLKYPILADR